MAACGTLASCAPRGLRWNINKDNLYLADDRCSSSNSFYYNFVATLSFSAPITKCPPLEAMSESSLISLDDIEVNISKNIVRRVYKFLSQTAKTDDIDQAITKIRRLCQTKVESSPHLFHEELVSVPKTLVDNWMRWMNFEQPNGLRPGTDLVAGKYEGGFKVWESSLDLVRFLSSDMQFIPPLMTKSHDSHLKILEIGAGGALPSIALLSRLMKGLTDFNYQIHFQDYNWQVLVSLTLLNLTTNLNALDLKPFIKRKILRFFHGDWRQFGDGIDCQYDLVLMSEVLYNLSNYQTLHDLIDKALEPDGIVFIATKCSYFGLSGDVSSWLDHVQFCDKFEVIKTFDNYELSIPRTILVIRRKNTQ